MLAGCFVPLFKEVAIPRVAGSHRISRSIYRRLILQMLLATPNHEVRARDVRVQIERRLRNRRSPADLEMRGNAPVWVNNLQWTKKALLMEGLLESVLSAGHGTWRLARSAVTKARQEVG